MNKWLFVQTWNQKINLFFIQIKFSRVYVFKLFILYKNECHDFQQSKSWINVFFYRIDFPYVRHFHSNVTVFTLCIYYYQNNWIFLVYKHILQQINMLKIQKQEVIYINIYHENTYSCRRISKINVNKIKKN